jgi:prolipoprotein diacylglyceryltransferase
VISFLISLIIISNLYKKRRVKISFLANNSLLIFFGGLIVSRLVFIIRNFQGFFHDFSLNSIFQIFAIWDKGLSIWGAIIGIVATLYWLCRKNEENFLAWMDILMVSLACGMIFSNIGTFLDGRNYGSPTDLPWGVIMESSQYAVSIHPTQIYASIYNLVITVVLFTLFDRKKFADEGRILFLGMFLYSLCRFLDEFVRGDESNIVLGLREAQIYAIIALFFSGYFLYKRFKPSPKTTS